MLFSSFSRKSIPSIITKTKRMFSAGGSHEEHAVEVARWYKLTLVMIGVSSLLTVYNIVFHEHEHIRTGLPYQKIRSKPFAWTCSSCDLFDNECWSECKSQKKTVKAGH